MNKTAEQIVAEVDDLVRDVWNAWDDPETLSGLILKLSVLYAPLGNYLAQARDEERKMDTYIKYHFANHKRSHIEHGDSVALAETKARTELENQYKDQDFAANRIDILKLKREDVEKLIDAARSRLSLIKGDIQRGQL